MIDEERKKRADAWSSKMKEDARLRNLGKNNSRYGCKDSAKTKQKKLDAWTLKRRKDMSERVSGENHPNYGCKASEKTLEKQRISQTGCGIDEKTRKKIAESTMGKNNHSYIDGKSNGGYPPEFNERLKKIIRDKFNNCNYISGLHKDIINSSQNLDVHHIDYDKLNISEDNLIPLSKYNHLITNTNRFFWEKLFKYSLNYEEEYYGEKGWNQVIMRPLDLSTEIINERR